MAPGARAFWHRPTLWRLSIASAEIERFTKYLRTVNVSDRHSAKHSKKKNQKLGAGSASPKELTEHAQPRFGNYRFRTLRNLSSAALWKTRTSCAQTLDLTLHIFVAYILLHGR